MPSKIKTSKRKHVSVPSDSEEEVESTRGGENTKRVRWGGDIEVTEEVEDIEGTNEATESDDEAQSQQVSTFSGQAKAI